MCVFVKRIRFALKSQGDEDLWKRCQTLFNNASSGYGAPPLSGITTETLHPIYNSVIADSSPPVNAAMTSDSGLTYKHLPGSRKRSRDSVNPMLSFPGCSYQQNNCCGSFTFLGEDISLQIQQQQLEIEQFITQHTEKVKIEIEERRKRYATRIFAAVEQGFHFSVIHHPQSIQYSSSLPSPLSISVPDAIFAYLSLLNSTVQNSRLSNRIILALTTTLLQR